MARIGIVGAGFTGTMVAVHLQTLLPAEAEIFLIDAKGEFGAGLAYSSFSDRMKLNVPASVMGSSAESPEDFYTWLQARGYTVKPDDFVPRKWFKIYLNELLSSTWGSSSNSTVSRVTTITDEVTNIVTTDHSKVFQLQFAGKTPPLSVDTVVLALGHQRRSEFLGHSVKGFFFDPYCPDSYVNAPELKSVLILGASLTAVDSILEFEGQGFKGMYHVVSRHGRFPVAHEEQVLPAEYPTWFMEKNRVSELVSLFRQSASTTQASQALIQAIRGKLQERWVALEQSEKARFIRHVQPYWDVNRHRIPVVHSEKLNQLIKEGRLRLCAGRIRTIDRISNGSSQVALQLRGKGALNKFEADRIVLCAGSESKISNMESALLKNLAEQKVIRQGQFGVAVQFDSSVLPTVHRERIHFIGPLQREDLWEITAVRELRVEAKRVSELIAKKVFEPKKSSCGSENGAYG